MTQTSFPFEDEDTTETQFSRWARNIGEGVVPDANGDALTVTVGTGLAVDVDPGQCLVRGHYYTSTAVESLSLATADASDPRLDTVVLRLDPTANSVVLAVVVGSPAAVPTAPALTQTDAGVYELPLANVLVPANSGVPTTITDRRVFARRLGELSDVTITSPASGEALVYDGTNWVNAAGGKILQVVSTTKTDTFSTTSSSFTDITGLSATITPSSASSKIMIVAQVALGAAGQLRLSGGNSGDFVGDAAGSRRRATIGYRQFLTGEFEGLAQSAIINLLDSPATASAITYQVQITIAALAAYVNRTTEDSDNISYTRGASSITLMEVAV